MPNQKNKTKSAAPKLGDFSGAQHGRFICQEVRTRKSFATALEVQTIAGEVLGSHSLPEPSAGHQITPDGQWVYVLTGGQVTPTGLLRRLIAVNPQRAVAREVGTSTSALPAVDRDYVAYFTSTAVIVETHNGERVFEKPVESLSHVHGSPAHACSLLANGRLAMSRGHRGADRIADLTVLDLADGREELTIELPVAVFHDKFVPRKLRADPQGQLVAILGIYAGLVMVDLRSSKDVADAYAPDPLDLADCRPTSHAHHTYSDLAFDEDGQRLAAAYSPGKVSVWDRGGAALRREAVAINPKAHRIVTFDAEGGAYFDSYGARARFGDS
jgi:hypothetical protein